MNYNIAVIEGDGIGPEVVNAAIEVLNTVGKKYKFSFVFKKVSAGGNAIDRFGTPLPKESVQTCLESNSVLLGAVGGPKWDILPGHLRPEKALLGIRKELELYANLRPARLLPELKDACPLRKEVADAGFDMIVVRELTGGMYFGESGRRDGKYGPEAYDTECYSALEVERIGVTAFELARSRGKKLISIDKANVLESSRLWREVMHRLAGKYPDVELSDMLVDNAAMQLVKNPKQFDVVVTSNIFGDILTDEASQITGSIGLLPSASLGETKRGMYEPIHGSAPDIAGQDKANPIATVLSAAMMLRLSLGQEDAARDVEDAVSRVLAKGLRTADIAAPGDDILPCSTMTKAILNALK
ncbi:3-isopropylmalate dehydrogenase [Sporobacter termitidis DSM 10068]|uniref:3-isopropylmalate dehydrogenase n=1 Tax=Sporobacter termitidis DSM 10068 TaxID=1123282 RepID=A0A1M5ZGX8_9FIRM|nr:3-isopropylmalate dehydrogenase [Sporobacter termitidis]SHI23401.1 3-isopropylmalate dehydrogenase [Sporobacter termitidis DSM 10068]